MRQFFLDLKIRTKLLLGFIFIGSILLTLGIRQYNVLMRVSDKDEIVMKVLETSNAISTCRYHLESEKENITELINSPDDPTLERWWTAHVSSLQGVRNHLTQIKYNTEKVISSEVLDNGQKIIVLVEEIEQEYNTVTIPSIQRARDKKLRILSIGSQPALNFPDSAQMRLRVFQRAEKDSLMRELGTTRNNVIKNSTKLISKFEEINALNDNIKIKLTEAKKTYVIWTIIKTNIIILVGLILSILIASFVASLIADRVHKLNQRISVLSRGELPEKLAVDSNDEIGEITESLNMLVEGLKNTSDFSYEIGKGDYASEFSPLSDRDVLGNSLLNMRDSLKQAKKDEEKRKLEDEQRNWTTEGLTKFTEILRKNTGEIKTLANNIIINLVKYLNANQGGLFIFNNQDKNDQYLELLATYAYNRKKFIEKHIRLGEGLVGVCALEKYTMYMTEIPEEYIEIESGLGLAKPTSLLIIPLKMDEEILGVVELASFAKFAPHEIHFVEQIAESIASSFSTIKINLRTAELLEQSQFQAQEMQDQEEEMRQNIEEMQATQEESIRREEVTRQQLEDLKQEREEMDKRERKQRKEIEKLISENEGILKAVKEQEQQSQQVLTNSFDSVITFDKDGKILFFNNAATTLTGYSQNEAIGKSIEILIPEHLQSSSKHILADYKNVSGALHHLDGDEVEIIDKMTGLHIVQISIVRTFVNTQETYTAFIHDLTDKKQGEKDRDKLMESLMAHEFVHQEYSKALEDRLKSHQIEIPVMKNNELIEWGENYILGIDTIDSQHKKWIDIINKLYLSFKEGKASKELLGYFDELLEFSNFHFNYEEDRFETYKYENKESHEIEHQEFISNIKELKKQYVDGKVSSAYQLMNLLREWVNFHIQVSDSGYVETFKKGK